MSYTLENSIRNLFKNIQTCLGVKTSMENIQNLYLTLESQKWIKALKNQRGDMGIVLIYSLLAFAAITNLFHKKLLLYKEEIDQRKNTYLCLKETFDSYSKYFKFIKHTNKIIKTLYGISLVRPTPEVFASLRTTKMAQEIKTKTIQIKILRYKKCSFTQKSILLTLLPVYLKKQKIHRSFSGSALVKKNKKFLIPSSEGNISFFILRGTFDYNNKLQVKGLKEIFLVRPELL